jgi:hypothetical protein
MPDLPVEVMNDLLALYLAGEASQESRRLVESYAATHPQYQRALAGAKDLNLPAPHIQAHGSDTDLHTLRRIREQLVLRTVFLAMAIATTLLPFTFTFHGTTIRMAFWNDGLEGIAYASIGVALASWTACFVMHRSLRRTGL